MSDDQLLPMTTAEWARAIAAADLLVGPGLGFNDATTGEWDAAVHITTGDRLTEDARAELIEELRKSISETVHRVLGTRVVRTWRRTRQQEDPHSSDLHHDYALGRDDLAIPRQVTGRCPNGHTVEDCTCGGGS